ncbi:MAG: nitronate monooxygenase [Planctomycetes bacterium]|nr:nitronate monooxygenase [Planctomycetota bacterium]
MGIGVSGWRLANAVARSGHLGVVSGTSLDTLLIRQLQDGDRAGHLRRAIAAFPDGATGEAVLRRWWQPGGRAAGQPYSLLPLPTATPDPARERLQVLAAFVEVWLAREGHASDIGINLLTKVRLPILPTLHGAMLAGVRWVLMGAGIPKHVPAALDELAGRRRATLPLDVTGATTARFVSFDPADHWPESGPPLLRPRFLAIVASHALATMLARKSSGRVDGFVVEAPTAGGHNAPPRREGGTNARGEPRYGCDDEVDLEALRRLGLPFWLAGGAGRPGALAAAQAVGAAGIQVGSLFAFCRESGLAEGPRRAVLDAIRAGRLDVFTDPRASPTGYPFKVLRGAGVPEAGTDRVRCCDLGYLRETYQREDGGLGYRCPGEPEAAWVQKGGRREECAGRRCLCNGLLANVGVGQLRDGDLELPLLTAGDDVARVRELLQDRDDYSATDVVDYLLATA